MNHLSILSLCVLVFIGAALAAPSLIGSWQLFGRSPQTGSLSCGGQYDCTYGNASSRAPWSFQLQFGAAGDLSIAFNTSSFTVGCYIMATPFMGSAALTATGLWASFGNSNNPSSGSLLVAVPPPAVTSLSLSPPPVIPPSIQQPYYCGNASIVQPALNLGSYLSNATTGEFQYSFTADGTYLLLVPPQASYATQAFFGGASVLAFAKV
jgi:hypothetical protein